MNVPDDYNRHRRYETWREANGYSRRARKESESRRRERVRNKEAGRFGKVNWEAYQHHQLYDMINLANPGEMSARAAQWNTLAAKIEGTTGEVQRVMERVMGAWHGQAAVYSAASNNRLMRWAGTASQTAGQIAEAMSTYTEAVVTAQKRMPEPGFATAERNFRDGYTIAGTGGPSTAVLLKELLSDGMVSHEESRARTAEAVQVMEAYEGQSKDVHDTMPHFSDVRPTTNQSVETWTPSQPDPTPTPSPRHPPSGPGTDDGTGAFPAPGAGGNSGTSAAGFVDGALPGAGPGAGAGSGGPGGTGSYGGGLGSLGSGGSDIVRNAPGYGGPGGLAGAGALPGRGPAGAAGLAGGGARGGGAPGAFGGVPGGHGAQGDEDKEHRNKYDLGVDFLDDLPPAYPSVFGA